MSVVPPKVTTYTPMMAGVDVDADGVTLGFIITPVEMVRITVPAESWDAIVAEAKEKSSGITVVKKPEIVVPGR